MEVWERFKPIAEFRPNPSRQCFKTCYNCALPWAEITTDHVHMVVPEQGARFVCDDCLEVIRE